MAFPNKTGRRVNYKYLARLDEALELVGHKAKDIPVHILRSPWPVIKDYIEDYLKLRVCSWCKLPKPADQMAPVSSMCKYHFDMLQNNKEARLNLTNRTHDGIRARRKASKYVEAMQDLLHPASEPENGNVGPSIREEARKPTAFDILDRADVRTNSHEDTKD